MNSSITQKIWDEIDGLDADPITDGSSRHCVTIEGVSAESWDSFWIQLHGGQMNFRHLDDTQRDEILGMILDSMDTPDDVELEPGGYVMFDVSALGRLVIDALLNRLIHEYYQILANSTLDVSTEEL